MRPTAQVDKPAMRIKADRFRLHVAQEFDLVGFSQLFKEADGVRLGHFLADKRKTGLGEFSHLLFDQFEIFRGERFVSIEIVVKSLFDGWTDGHLDVFAEHFLDSQGHDVGCRVPQYLNTLFGQHRNWLKNGIGHESV